MEKPTWKFEFYEMAWNPFKRSLAEYAHACISRDVPVVILGPPNLSAGHLIRWKDTKIIARIVRPATMEDVTQTRKALGKPHTQPPEGPVYVIEALD